MSAPFTGSLVHRVAFVPAAVFLSVVFGGSYGSGQEVVQFVSAAGPVGGYWALMVVVLIWGLLLGLSFEIARFSTPTSTRASCGFCCARAGSPTNASSC